MKTASKLLSMSLCVYACSAQSDGNVADFIQLQTLFKEHAETNLCYWYYDDFRSEEDTKYYHLEYICSPSEDYNGSRLVREKSIIVSKAEVIINKHGGRVGINDITAYK